MKPNNLLVLTQFYFPDKVSTGKVLAELFMGLSRKSFSISVVAGRTMYQDKNNTILPAVEQFANFEIYRVSKRVMPKEKAWGRLYNYIAFFSLSVLKVIKNDLHKNADLVFCVSNPPIMPLLGAWLKNDKNKFIYLIHDLYPDIAIRLGVVGEKNLMSRFMYRVNRYVFAKVDVVIVLGRDMKEYLIQNYAIPAEKITVLPNWSKPLNLSRKAFIPGNKFRLLYTGNMGKFHDLELAVYAAELLPETMELIFVGEGAKKELLQSIVAQRQISNVKFFGYLDQTEYVQMLSSADALLLSLEKGMAGLAVPSKFYTYLAAGKPVIAITDEASEVAIAICEEKCGVVMRHDDVEFFVGQITKLITTPELCNTMGNNALQAFEQKYEQSIVISKYEELFCQLCAGTR